MDRNAQLALWVQEYRSVGPRSGCAVSGDECGYDECERDNREYFGLSFMRTITHACSKRSPTGRFYKHQRRIPPALLEAAFAQAKLLQRELETATSFDEIHRIVVAIAARIKGLDEVFSYDVATRIGAATGKVPTVVYLHAGTREGAENLLKRKLGQTLEVGDLPVPLRKLGAVHLENFLCIYKNCLVRL